MHKQLEPALKQMLEAMKLEKRKAVESAAEVWESAAALTQERPMRGATDA